MKKKKFSLKDLTDTNLLLTITIVVFFLMSARSCSRAAALQNRRHSLIS